MPIKSKDEIYYFFEKNIAKEFIHFQSKEYDVKNNERFDKFYLFPYYERSKYKIFFKKIEKNFLKIQNFFKISRIKNKNIKFQKGANWFSITNDFVKYILKQEKWIRKTFKFTSCCDEIFLQTLIINSRFKNRVYNKNMDDNHITSIKRYVDWKRGNPYVFRKEDFNDLVNSEALFARKFDLSIDKEIVNMIEKKFLKEYKN